MLVQEYGRYFGMKTCALRGGCLTGPSHSGVELHGFLSYLVKVNVEKRLYRIYGYKGKQVRDNIHSRDVARFAEAFIAAPRVGEVYNLGGGKGNACSILEAFQMVSARTGKPMQYEYDETNRIGDHICYYSDLRKMMSHYPELVDHHTAGHDLRRDRGGLAAAAEVSGRCRASCWSPTRTSRSGAGGAGRTLANLFSRYPADSLLAISGSTTVPYVMEGGHRVLAGAPGLPGRFVEPLRRVVGDLDAAWAHWPAAAGTARGGRLRPATGAGHAYAPGGHRARRAVPVAGAAGHVPDG